MIERIGQRVVRRQASSRTARSRRPRWSSAVRFGLLAGVLVGLAALGAGGPAPPSALGLPPSAIDPRSEPLPEGESIRFTHGGHVLAFGPDAVIVAGGDHALKLEFVGATGGEFRSSTAPSPDGRAQPLDTVTYPDLWDGISVVYEAAIEGIVKTTYRIAPGATVGRIRLRYNVPVLIDGGGRLVLVFATGTLRENAPVAWQEIEGKRVPVEVAFRVLSEHEVDLAVGDYDPGRPLIIDPAIVWNTFLGGAGTDCSHDVAVDATGNLYVVGSSTATWGTPIRPHQGGDSDSFVAKLNGDGELLWSTFLGGEALDEARSVAFDGSGNLYVVGSSAATWGTPACPYQGGDSDAFVAKLNSDGELLWNSFLGGPGSDAGWGVAFDAGIGILVVGDSDAAWSAAPVGRPYQGGTDAFVSCVFGDGWPFSITFLGGPGDDHGRGVTIDEFGATWIVGDSDATWWHTGQAHQGGSDVFITCLSGQHLSLVTNRFLGGPGEDIGHDVIACEDALGNELLFVVGESNATWGTPIRSYSGGFDAFAVELWSRWYGDAIPQWNSFFGASGLDHGLAVTADATGFGNVYVVGASDATWGSPFPQHEAGEDAFVADLYTHGTVQWNGFLGGAGHDGGTGVAVDADARVAVVGDSDATWGVPIQAHQGGVDAFVARLGEPPDMEVYCEEIGPIVIEDGSTDPDSSLGTDFLSVPVGAQVENTFIIRNIGGADLEPTGTLKLTGLPMIQVTGDNAPEFLVTSQPSTTSLGYSESTTFSIEFAPAAAGLRTATIIIPSNDPFKDPYDFAIQGTGTLCEIGVQGSGQSIPDGDTEPSANDGTDFGEAFVDAVHVDRTFTICNSGTAELSLTGSPCVQVTGGHAVDFTVTVQPSTPIADDGGTCTFTVRFAPSTPGLRTATITIPNDDPDENPYDFAICGTGLEPGTQTAAAFRVDASGDVLSDGTFTAPLFVTNLADVAEWVTISEPVEAGDVLALDPSNPGAYRRSQRANSSYVAGVVASNPGVVLGMDVSRGERALLALVGIVPVKVTDEGGPIEPGDLLVSSSTPGHAMCWDGAGSPALIGKALESMTDETGLILVLLVAH